MKVIANIFGVLLTRIVFENGFGYLLEVYFMNTTVNIITVLYCHDSFGSLILRLSRLQTHRPRVSARHGAASFSNTSASGFR